MKHGNIALFVPHNGCPNQCTFCNQRSITGKQSQPTARDVDKAAERALSGNREFDYEIAFFGGSFTAIDREYMISLLKAAHKYVAGGAVKGIRISTRPDAIDDEVLGILKEYGVTSIELGAQSMCDDVLLSNRRGHTADDVRAASKRIRESGFSLGLQMMTGLYKSSDEKDIYTAKQIIALNPDTVRIYPTVTMDNTDLGELYKCGEFTPTPLWQSVNLCALLFRMFEESNIEVIRLGLHYSEELEHGMLFNNYHPAFRELVEGQLMLEEFLRMAEPYKNGEALTKLKVRLNPCDVSKFVGQKKRNIRAINESGFSVKIVQDKTLSKRQILVELQGEEI